MIRIAVLGAGRIGRIHGRNAASHPDARLVAVADPHADVAGAAMGEAAIEQRSGGLADRVPSLVFGHAHALAPPFARLARW